MQYHVEERPTFPKSEKKVRQDFGPQRDALEHAGDKSRAQRKMYRRSEFTKVRTGGRVAKQDDTE